MKKHLIAAAVAGAFAVPAIAQVTISGVVDIGYGTVNAPANGASVQTGDISRVAMNGSATSALIFGMTEDLGGGLKAIGRLELNPDYSGGTGVVGGAGAVSGAGATGLGTGANGYSFVGLEGGFGKILLGRLNTGTLQAWGNLSPFGTGIGSGYGASGIYARYGAAGNLNNTAPTRFNGAIEYTTPTVNGLAGRVLYVPGTNRSGVGTNLACSAAACAEEGNTSSIGSNRADVTDISASFTVPNVVTIVVARQVVEVGANAMANAASPIFAGTAGLKNTLTTVSASGRVAGATLRVGYWTEKATTTAGGATPTTDANSYSLGVSYPIGAVAVHGFMIKNNDRLAANADRELLGLGADYSLSKRTAAYLRYENRDANTNSTADTAAAGETKITHVGIRHTF